MRLGTLAATAFAVVASLVTTPARAAEAPVSLRAPVGSVTPLLGYGAGYTSDGRALTHHGLDFAADAGVPVTAPFSGQVVFAGAIPAAGGGTVLAVTIEEPGGLRVTLLPIERARVSAGTAVVAGDAVGSLAAAGDASSAAPHLHLGLRRGETYLDPTAMLETAGGTADVVDAGVAAESVPTPRPPVSGRVMPPAQPASIARQATRAEAPRDAPSVAAPVPAPRVQSRLRADVRSAPEPVGAPEVSPAYPARTEDSGTLTLVLSAACAVCAAAGLALPRLVPARVARKAGA